MLIMTFEQISRYLMPQLKQYIDERIDALIDTPVTKTEVQSILGGTYTPVADADSITAAEVQSILDGTYTPTENEFSAEDFTYA